MKAKNKKAALITIGVAIGLVIGRLSKRKKWVMKLPVNVILDEEKIKREVLENLEGDFY